MRNIVRRIVLTAALCGSAAHADVAEMAAACDSCHGANGVSQWDDMPTIAGISAFAHADALYIYRDRARPCEKSHYRLGDAGGPATDMCAITAKLSDDQIEAIAEHYAGKPFVAAQQQTDAALVARGQALHKEHCERCHTEAGGNPEDDASILAGQRMGYLRKSFADYRADTREQSAKMAVKLEKIGDDDIEALVHYYGSRR